MTLPITAQGFDHPHQLGLKRRMARCDGGESLDVGQPGQLVQIAGKALELGEPFEVFTPQPLRISCRSTSVRGMPAARASARSLKLQAVLHRRVMRYSCFRARPKGGRPPFFGVFMDWNF
jgi:hypothetical protein